MTTVNTQNLVELHLKSARELKAGLDAGEYTSLDLTNYFLARIEGLDGQINACNFVCADSARAAATAFHASSADSGAQADDALGVLAGLPLAHKDILVSVDSPTTAGSRMLEGYRSPFDATVVAKLARVGMINLAKLNMDEFAMGSSSESSYFGATKNPWDTTRVPGGSSGGSAAAVAAGLIPFATATDTGGSIRQPASFCGVTGIKPTYGAVSRFGIIAYASSLDQAGVMARRAEDCALVLEAMIGRDPRDSTSLEHPSLDLVGAIDSVKGDQPLAGKRIGVPRDYLDAGLDPCVARVTHDAIAVYESLGATIVDIELPNTDHAIAAYYLIAASEASSNLSRFDGVRFGHRASEAEDLDDLYEKTRSEGFGDEVKRRILIGTYALSAGYFDAYYIKAQKVRRLIRDSYRKAFEGCDMILTPVAPTPAYKLGEKQDSVSMYLGDAFTIGVNLAGLPALSHPAGFSKDGLPIGAQLIGPAWHEAQILAAAHAFQQVTDHHMQEPELSKMSTQPAPQEDEL